MGLCVSCFLLAANGTVQPRGTICCRCCRRWRPFYPNSDRISFHFHFRQCFHGLHCLSPRLSSVSRLLPSCASWRWVDKSCSISPSSRPLTTLFGITVSVVEVAGPLREPGAGPPLEVRLCWPRLGRPLRVAPAVSRWAWRQTVRIPAIPRT